MTCYLHQGYKLLNRGKSNSPSFQFQCVYAINVSSLRQATQTIDYYISLQFFLPWNLNRSLVSTVFHIQITKQEGISVITRNNSQYSLAKPCNLMPTTSEFFNLSFQTSHFQQELSVSP